MSCCPTASTIGFDLKSPCGDCPFRRDVAPHAGIAGKMATYKAQIESGFFLHSCHKTDPKADYEQPKPINGKIQHCAGALIMLEKSRMRQIPVGEVIDAGLVDLSDLDMNAPVFGSVKEMVRHYTPAIRARLKEWLEQNPLSPMAGELREALGEI